MSRVVIIDCNYLPDEPHVVFVTLKVNLERAGVSLTVDNHWSEDYLGADLIIGADPLGVPPLKWSTNWDRFIPQIGGPEDGWKAKQTGSDCIETAAG